jgi:hypothetical protein
MNESTERLELGLKPRLVAAGWFALTACVPIVGFFGVIGGRVFIGPSAAAEPAVASIFIFVPISMAAFFGFLIGSKILNHQIVKALRAAAYGALVAILSYAGFMVIYAAILVFQTARPDADVLKSFLTVFFVGLVMVGWLVLLAGALGGWLLYWLARNWIRVDSARNVTSRRPLYLNLWATVALAGLLFICWLPVKRFTDREQAEEQKRKLIDAVHQNNLPELERLLDLGMSVETRDVGGSTLLLTAASNGETRIVRMLVARGANPNAKADRWGQSALHLAVSNFDVESIKALLANGANVNAIDDYGRTPLLLAASTTDRATVKFLIEHGANRDWTDHYGNSALALARRDRDLTGTQDRDGDSFAQRLDAGRNFGDSRDYQNPKIIKRARDRHDAIIELLRSYGLR